MKKIKKGRYPGQPEWMPDCELWIGIDDHIFYRIPEIVDICGSSLICANVGAEEEGYVFMFANKGDLKPVYEGFDPVHGKRYAFWEDEGVGFFIAPFYKVNTEGQYVSISESCYTPWHHIAKIDGIDLNCSVEELKERTEWM